MFFGTGVFLYRFSNRQFFRSAMYKIKSVMKLDIYIDVLIILNTYMTWILLSLTAALTKTHSFGGRRALASVIGGLSSLMILIPTPDKLIGFTLIILKAFTCMLTVIIAFWRQTVKKTFLLTVAFFGVNMLFSAALTAVQTALKSQLIAVSGGFIYFDISPLNLVLSTAVIYLILCKTSKLFSRDLSTNNSYRVEFTVGCKAFSLDGVADTGNTARDLFSGLPVIVCTGVEISDGDRLRAVPYETVSGEGILYAFSPENLRITDGSGKIMNVSALVAGVPSSGGRRAIFNPKILM